MDDAEFWALVEGHLTKGRGDPDERVERLTATLSKRRPAEIRAFQRQLDRAMDRAYRWDLWGVAYVIEGGCSDDGFEYFRAWLISRGRAVYERALADPESLVEQVPDDADWYPELESLLYAPAEAYESVTDGEELPPRDPPTPREPAGTRFDEDRAEEQFPRVAARIAELRR